MVRISVVVAALAAVVAGAPAPNPDALERRQTCTGQSCLIADLSRSTGRIPDPNAAFEGGSAAGTACIRQHLATLQSQGRIRPDDDLWVPAPRKRQLGGCKPYTLLYARGTGLLDGYPADMAGNDCIGLNGGVAMMNLIERTAQACPNTKIIVSGYSQGAMVAHNGVAFASAAAKRQVAGVVVFGDPFNGAPIKDFDSSKIKTFCHSGDGVCEGKFEITLAHLTYSLLDSRAAIRWIEQAVGA